MSQTTKMIAPATQGFEHIANILLHLRPRMEEVLRRYEIPASDAQILLEETFIELLYQAERAEDIAGRLIARLRNRCRRHWAARRRRVAQAVERTLLQP